jgi:hypothetical protein
MLDLRQTLEAAVCTAFAIAHNDPVLFVDTREDGILDSSKTLAAKRYRCELDPIRGTTGRWI